MSVYGIVSHFEIRSGSLVTIGEGMIHFTEFPPVEMYV